MLLSADTSGFGPNIGFRNENGIWFISDLVVTSRHSFCSALMDIWPHI